MIAGSTSYTYMGNDSTDVIQTLNSVPFDVYGPKYHLDYVAYGSPFFVREDGVYCLFFEIGTAEACQFSFYVNGVIIDLSSISTNSGAGQVLARQMLELKANDNILVINTSSNITVNSIISSGGTNEGNGACIVIFKIAPLTAAVCDEKKLKCLSHKKKKLFKKLEHKLECDAELMPKGFTVHGSVTNGDQLVALEGDVSFSSLHEASGVSWNIGSPTQVVVSEDGIYHTYFQLNTQTAAQFAITVNGVPDETTTYGINKGAGQLTSRSLLTLKAGDVLTVRNHSSNVGSVQITSNAGGLNTGVSALFMLYKIAPIVKPCIKPLPCKMEKALECLYPKFKNYLLCQCELAVAGSSAYIDIANSCNQVVAKTQPFYWTTESENKNILYKTGDTTVDVVESGVYDIFVEIAVNEPVQISIAVNGVPVPSTIFGRDSGAARVYLRQFLSLNKGDKVSVINNLSASPDVTTVLSGNGQYISNNALINIFKMHPICPPKPCPPKPCPQ